MSASLQQFSCEGLRTIRSSPSGINNPQPLFGTSVNKTTDRNTLREDRFALVHSFGGISVWPDEKCMVVGVSPAVAVGAFGGCPRGNRKSSDLVRTRDAGNLQTPVTFFYQPDLIS